MKKGIFKKVVGQIVKGGLSIVTAPIMENIKSEDGGTGKISIPRLIGLVIVVGIVAAVLLGKDPTVLIGLLIK